MAGKKETYNSVVAEVETLCINHGVSKDFKDALTNIVDKYLAPKSSGASVNIDEVTKKDGEGNIVEIQCSLSGVFLPATEEYFYADKQGKGINGLRRLSRKAEAIRKQETKRITTSEKAITSDVLEGVIDREEGKAKIEELKATKIDYSGVTA